MTVLRTMTTADLAWVLPAERELFAQDPPWSERMYREELAGVPDTRWYVVVEDTGHDATADDAPCGWAGLSVASDGTADLQTLAVLPGRRRRGLGGTLLRAVLDEARRRGASRVLLEVRADNDAARALYAAHGFDDVRVRRGYYGTGRFDGVVMVRELDAAPTVGGSVG